MHSGRVQEEKYCMLSSVGKRFNNNTTIHQKILLLFIPLMLATVFLFGQISNTIYLDYIRQLTYNDLAQRTKKLKLDVENRLLAYRKTFDYLYVNNEIDIILKKYNNNEQMWSEFIDDHKELVRVAQRALVESCTPRLYVFNKNFVCDNIIIKKITEFPTPQLIDSMSIGTQNVLWSVIRGKSGSNDSELMISRLLEDAEHNPAAILSLEINLDELKKIFNTNNTGYGGWYTYEMSDGNVIIISSKDKEELRGTNLVFFENIDINNTKIKVKYSEELIRKVGSTQRRTLLIVAFVFILLASAVTYGISMLAVNRMRLFLKKIKAIKENTYKNIDIIDGKDEIAEIDENFNEMFYLLKENAKREHKLETGKKIIESELLQAQFNPHFLYNTLSVLRWSKDRESSQKLIDCLILFYRATLGGGKFIIPIFKEMEIIKNYIEIHKYVYDDNFKVKLDISPEVEKLFCIKFILQPFVENSIIHGINENETGSKIGIEVRKEDEKVVFCISDNGKGMEKNLVDRLNFINMEEDYSCYTGYGILNVVRRIKLYYGNEYGIVFDSSPGVGTKVIITIPVCHHEQDKIILY